MKMTKENSYFRRIGKLGAGSHWGETELHKGIHGKNKCDVCGKTLWLNPGGYKYCDECIAVPSPTPLSPAVKN